MRLIVSLLLVLLSMQTQAANQYYGEVRLGIGGVRHSDLDFFPKFGSLSGGLFIFDNIGIEAFVDVPLTASDKSAFELDVTQAAGVAVRFQSPPQRGLQAYILIGYVNFTLEQEENGVLGRRTIKQSFDGARVSIGVNQRLEVMDGLIFGVEYRNYHADSGIVVDGVSLGLRYEIQ